MYDRLGIKGRQAQMDVLASLFVDSYVRFGMIHIGSVA